MSTRRKRIVFFLMLALLGLGAFLNTPSTLIVTAQQPTGSVPTVTGTAAGMVVRVNFDLNTIPVHSGPSSYLYPVIGVLLKGQEVPAYGVSADGNWLQVYYPGVPNSLGWIYGPYVTIINRGPLPQLPAPPTPSPTLSLLDPTLAAAFETPITPTRLPTFTAPAPLVLPTFLPDASSANRIPVGLTILVFGFLGAFGTIISFLRGR